MTYHGLMLGNFDSNSMAPYRGFGNHRIATHLRKQGWDIECLDYTVHFTDDEIKWLLANRITKNTVFIGLSIIFYLELQGDVQRVNRIIGHIRNKYPWVQIVAGGVKWFAVGLVDADWYVTGNGEFAMDAILKYLTGNGSEPKHVSARNGKLIDAVHAYPCFPKRDARISFEERDHIQPHEALNIELARGCKFKCKYCSFPLIGLKGDMTRDEDSVYEELKENYDRWGVTNYYVTDDTVNDTTEKMEKMANAIRRLDFKPSLHGYARADLLIHHGRKTWDDMIDMGLISHSYGVETLNHQSGKEVGKGMNPEKVKEGLLEVEEYFNKNTDTFYTGSLTMIAGLPYESFETLDNGKEWLNKYWNNHGIKYLPLLIHEPKDTSYNEIDMSNANNFKKYGYTFLHDVPPTYDKGMFDYFGEIKKKKENAKGHDGIYFNFWTHHSDEYDFIDMIDWVRDFNEERDEKKMNSNFCFDIGYTSLASEDSELKNFYGEDCQQIDKPEIMSKMLDKYKYDKLNG